MCSGHCKQKGTFTPESKMKLMNNNKRKRRLDSGETLCALHEPVEMNQYDVPLLGRSKQRTKQA